MQVKDLIWDLEIANELKSLKNDEMWKSQLQAIKLQKLKAEDGNDE